MPKFRVAILHAYSADNAGDGLLVAEAVDILAEALGDDLDLTLAAWRPETFGSFQGRVVNTFPHTLREAALYLRFLVSLNRYDLVVGVGGGYLRFGEPIESLKTTYAHVPQLLAAVASRSRVAYFPQSVGPFRCGSGPAARSLLRRIPLLALRDDRSMIELGAAQAVRTPDLAILSRSVAARSGGLASDRPVLSVRKVRGRIPEGVLELAQMAGEYDGYVQSRTGNNDDSAAMAQLRPRSYIERSQLHAPGTGRRVVVAMRLHAALMALNAGHYVIHLAYERKGFGAFQDLGLSEYVFNANSFRAADVHRLMLKLANNAESREDYDLTLAGSREYIVEARHQLVNAVRALCPERTSS